MFCRVSGPFRLRTVTPSRRPSAVMVSGASRMATSVWSHWLRGDEFLLQFRQIGRGVDIDLASGQRYGLERPGITGKQRPSAAVPAQIAQLGKMAGGKEGRNAVNPAIFRGNYAPVGLAPGGDEHA